MSASSTKPRPWIVDFLSTLFLAFCIGIGTSVVLGAAVVLMASEARGAEGVRPIETVPMTAPEAQPGALLLKANAQDDAVAAPLLDTDVVIRVSGTVARARVRQTFLNPYDRRYQGVYVFALPGNSAVAHLRVKIGGRVVEGVPRPAPGGEERPNAFVASVADIAPHDDIVVELEYRQSLRPGPALTVF